MNLTFLERNQMLIGTIAAAAILASVLGGLAVQGGIFRPGFSLDVEFANAAGLSPGDHVLVAGARVGTVDAMTLGTDRVIATMTVDAELPKDTRAKILLRTLVGARAVELIAEGDWDDLLGPGDTIPVEHTDLPVDLPEFSEVSEDLLSQSDTAAFDEFLVAVTEILRGQRTQVSSLIEGGRRLSAVVSDQEQDVRRLIKGLRVVGEALAARDKELATIVDDFGEVVGALAVRRDELRRFLRGTNAAAGAAADLVRDERAQLDSILSDVHVVADVLSRNQLNFAEALAYAGDAIEGFASISYAGAQRVPWGYVYTSSLGTAGVDAISGCGGLIDRYLDQTFGPDPRSCAEQDNDTFPEDTNNQQVSSLSLATVARRSLPSTVAARLVAVEVRR